MCNTIDIDLILWLFCSSDFTVSIRAPAECCQVKSCSVLMPVWDNQLFLISLCVTLKMYFMLSSNNYSHLSQSNSFHIKMPTYFLWLSVRLSVLSFGS